MTPRQDILPAPLGSLDAELDALLRRHARVVALAPKEALYLRGSPPDALFCIDAGIVRLSVTSAGGREAVLGLVTAGHWFGEASLFTGEPRGHDAVAVVDSQVLVVPRATLHELVDDQPDYLLQFLRLMGLRYRWTLARMDHSRLQNLPARLAGIIVEACRIEAERSVVKSGAHITIAQEDLAHILGASRQSINKVLKSWERQGILQVSYRSIIVTDLQSLSIMADER